jgi:hypothetical protein
MKVQTLSCRVYKSLVMRTSKFFRFIQEFRAERAMAALKRMAEAGAQVLRGGQKEIIHASELVPGDVVLLEAGTRHKIDVDGQTLVLGTEINPLEIPRIGNTQSGFKDLILHCCTHYKMKAQSCRIGTLE